MKKLSVPKLSNPQKPRMFLIPHCINAFMSGILDAVVCFSAEATVAEATVAASEDVAADKSFSTGAFQYNWKSGLFIYLQI